MEIMVIILENNRLELNIYIRGRYLFYLFRTLIYNSENKDLLCGGKID